MIGPTGNAIPLDAATASDYLTGITPIPDDHLVVVGDDDTIRTMAAKVALGHNERERRSTRRRQQRRSRKRNR